MGRINNKKKNRDGRTSSGGAIVASTNTSTTTATDCFYYHYNGGITADSTIGYITSTLGATLMLAKINSNTSTNTINVVDVNDNGNKYSGDDVDVDDHSSSWCCFHGSTEERFLYKNEYHDCCDDYVKYRSDMAIALRIDNNGSDSNSNSSHHPTSTTTTTAGDDLNMEFTNKHVRTLIQPEFGRFVFAVCTGLYLLHDKQQREGNENVMTNQRKGIIRSLLALAIDVKYQHVPSAIIHMQKMGISNSLSLSSSAADEDEDDSTTSTIVVDVDKHRRYCRDIMTDRGMINVLARGTLGASNNCSNCNCMKEIKNKSKQQIKVNGGQKLGFCIGCRKEYPKKQLRSCSSCLASKYCSKKCQIEDWSMHKQFCKEVESTLECNNSVSAVKQSRPE